MTGLLALALLVQAPDADSLQSRDGLYLGFSIGPAISGLSCEGCSAATGTEATLQLSGGAGIAVSPHLTLGLQLGGWNHQEGNAGFWATSAVLTWYPATGSGAFIRPTLGVASFRGASYADGPTEEGSGVTLGLTLGHDLRFDKKMSLTPALTIQYADIGTTTMVGLPDRSNLRSWMVGFGVGLTWH